MGGNDTCYFQTEASRDTSRSHCLLFSPCHETSNIPSCSISLDTGVKREWSKSVIHPELTFTCIRNKNCHCNSPRFWSYLLPQLILALLSWLIQITVKEDSIKESEERERSWYFNEEEESSTSWAQGKRTLS